MTEADRLPPLPLESMDDAQRAAAEELIAGPRKAVKGPFIALLRSPELLSRVQRVGELLRFGSVLPQRLNEWATLVVSRSWTQQFEWAVHTPLAMKAGVARESVESLREGRRPRSMAEDEAVVHDFAVELMHHKGVSDATYGEAVRLLGERGVVELTTLIGYFVMLSMVLNVAHTPAEKGSEVASLPPLPR
ncbi:MAG TPA: carboxymuconolactone decarboxylase family protein [Burkholderiaceae bacterium]|nr:carboxymuconolactone decarboxylase family protein [Burkholderiaceae bacterium]